MAVPEPVPNPSSPTPGPSPEPTGALLPLILLYNPRAPFHTMPLGLLAVASALDRSRFEVAIVDGRLEADPPAALERRMAGRRTLLLGMGVLTGAPIGDALAVSRAMKAAHPGLPVVWGGWHPSLFPTECLAEASVGITVQGQGEATLADLVERLAVGSPLDDCLGISFRRPDGAIQQNPPRPWLTQEQLQPVDYALLDVERYFGFKGRRQLDYVSSQGCFWRCGFCADPRVYGRQWSGQGGAALAERLLALHDRYLFDDLNFQDETFFTRPKEVLEMAERLLAAGRPFSWAATMRADQGDRLADVDFDLLAASGLRRVLVGVESGSQAMLDWMQKDIQLPQVLVTAEKCRRAGIGVEFPFIVGFPGESAAAVTASLNLAWTLRAMSPRFTTPIFFFRPYPGSAITQEMERQGHRLPSSLEEWARFDIYGGGSWVDETTLSRVERFRFYQRIGWDPPPGAWKRPLAALARWRCRSGRFGWPLEMLAAERLKPRRALS